MTSLMLEETREAPERLRAMLAADADAYAAVAEELRRHEPAFLVTIARGSSDHAGAYLASLAGILAGRLTASLPPSLVTRYGADLAFKGAFAVALSQSGGSPDLVQALEAARDGGAVTAAIVNQEGSPLAAAARHRLPQRAGPERSVAATKSVIATMACSARLVGTWCREEGLLNGLAALPDSLDAALACDWTSALDALAGASRLYVLARGPGLGTALETALKLKETTGLQAEAFSAAELRHGPKAIIGPGFPVLAYALADPGGGDVRELAAELAGAGANVLLATQGAAPAGVARLPLPAPLHPLLDPIAALLAFYPMAEALARRRGRDPDRPPGLMKVTRTV